jgi:hypothetical protein
MRTAGCARAGQRLRDWRSIDFALLRTPTACRPFRPVAFSCHDRHMKMPRAGRMPALPRTTPVAVRPVPGGAKLRRSDLFIATTPAPPPPQPRRGGMSLLPHGHVAPPGLGAIDVDFRCYKHLAPLGLAGRRWIEAAEWSGHRCWRSASGASIRCTVFGDSMLMLFGRAVLKPSQSRVECPRL